MIEKGLRAFKYERLNAMLTIYQVMAISGLSSKTMIALEHGTSKPTWRTIFKWNKAFDFDRDRLRALVQGRCEPTDEQWNKVNLYHRGKDRDKGPWRGQWKGL